MSKDIFECDVCGLNFRWEEKGECASIELDKKGGLLSFGLTCKRCRENPEEGKRRMDERDLFEEQSDDNADTWKGDGV